MFEKRVLALLLSAFLGGCTVDLETPAGARLACGNDSDCPADYACSPVLWTCVKKNAGGQAPSIVSASLRCPGGFDAARAGDSVEVELEVGAPLARAPEVRLDGPAGRPLLLVSEEGQRYRFALGVQAADPEGSWNLLASLVGVDGAVALNQPLGVALVIDHRRPELAGLPIVEPAAVTDGERFSVTLSVDEPLARAPGLALLVPGAEAVAETTGEPEQLDATRWRFELIARAAAMPDAEAWAAAGIDLLDRAGNAATLEVERLVRLDFRAPAALSEAARAMITSAPDNPLATPEALTVGSRLDVWFSLDEALTPGSTVELCAGLTPPLCASTAADGSPVYHLALALDESYAGHADGSFALRVTATDLVGNTGSSTLGGALAMAVDTHAPQAPVVEELVYTRIPYGFSHGEPGAAVHHGPGFFVHGAAGSVEADATVLALNADDGFAEEIGRTPAGADGSFGADPLAAAGPGAAFALRRADREEVWVQALDAAGNRSPSAKVARTVWVATLGGKLAGDTLRNPLTVLEQQALGSEPGSPQAELGASGLEALDDGHTHASQPRGQWRQPSLEWPTDQWLHAGTYDSRNQRVLIYQRLASDCASNAALARCQPLWARTGSTWSAVQAAADSPLPTPRLGAALAFDARRGRALLLGGKHTIVSALVGDAWWWDGTRWSVACASGDASCSDPASRRDHALVYDSRRDRLVLFGGRAADSSLQGGTWEYDGTSWARRNDLGTEPALRFGHAMAYDQASGKTFLFGGTTRDPAGRYEELSDLWEYDGNAWTRRCDGAPASDICASMPPALRHVTLAFDEARGVLVLNGGGPSLMPIGTWEWDGAAWSQASGTDRSGDGEPAQRWGAVAVYDRGRERVVLVGGTNQVYGNSGAIVRQEPAAPTTTPTIDDETWERGAHDWVSSAPRSFPGPRLDASHPLAADPGRGVLASWDPTWLTLWSWNGALWLKPTLTDAAGDGNPMDNPPQSTSYTYGIAYDTARQQLVLLGSPPGSTLSRTWRLEPSADGGSFDWRLADAGSPRATEALLVNDPVEGKLLVLTPADGAYSRSRFYQWDGTAWEERCDGVPADDSCALPPALARSAIAWDAGRARAVVVGSPGPIDTLHPPTCTQTWEWDGQDWLLRAEGAASVPPAYGIRLAYDPAAARVLWHDNQGTLWAWDGSRWRTVVPGSAPAGTSWSHQLAWSPESGELVWSRPESVAAQAHTFTWSSRLAWPSQRLEVPVAAAQPSLAGLGDGGAALREALEGLEVRWYAGGSGTSGTASDPGAELLVFANGTWQSAGAHASASPALLERSFAGTELSELVLEETGASGPSVRVAARARATGFVDSLESDYLEVRLRFWRP